MLRTTTFENEPKFFQLAVCSPPCPPSPGGEANLKKITKNMGRKVAFREGTRVKIRGTTTTTTKSRAKFH